MLRSLLLYLSEREGPKSLLTGLPAGRRLAARFIAGEKLDDAIRAVRQLNAEGFEVTLDHLGESVNDHATADEACRVYIDLLDRIAEEGLRSHISIKLTQLGLAISEQLTQRLLGTLCEAAARHHNFVRIDMESSAYVDATLRVFRQAAAPRDVLGVVIQSYLYRSERDVEALLKDGVRIRLVKGAYQEPRQIAYPDKKDVDRNFVAIMQKLLLSGIYHGIATHDAHVVAATEAWARAHQLPADRFEFQMLYGVQRQLQRSLLERGYRVRVYVPYGSQWYAYFMRRLAERPANVFFVLRQLFQQ
jgi:proline dehydrogenase